MDIKRATPEQILKMIEQEKNSNQNDNYGKLKIFFGYAAGVGKTYSMLKAAQEDLKDGKDVVVGYVEPHSRPDTMKLVDGLEIIRPKIIEYKGIKIREFDLDSALKRHPQIILVDELAHTNAQGSRHTKRYQDISELLSNGIDVYTTVNVQHIESLNDIVERLTNIKVRERIPDKIFDDADKVELVDIEPEELIKRLEEGKIYKNEQAKRAMDNFFTEENLISLRETALRKMADRVNKISEQHSKQSTIKNADEHVLVCLSSSPSNEKIIRAAYRIKDAFKCKFSGIYVETSNSSDMNDDDKKRLKSNMKLAETLGANVETIYGDDIAYQIGEYARLHGVTKMVMGRHNTKRNFLSTKNSFVDKLMNQDLDLDIYIIPDNIHTKYKTKISSNNSTKEKLTFKDLFITIGILVAATLISLLLEKIGLVSESVGIVYVLGALFTGVFTNRRIFPVVYSFISVLTYNFFFTYPRLSFRVRDPQYSFIFLIVIISALMGSYLMERIKYQTKRYAKTAFQTSLLLATNELIQIEKTDKGIATVVGKQIERILNRPVLIYLKKDDDKTLNDPIIFTEQDEVIDKRCINVNEKAVVQWVFKNNKRAGRGTGTLNSSRCIYYSIRGSEGRYGVVGIDLQKGDMNNDEKSVFMALISTLGVALERSYLIRKSNEAIMKAKNEQLKYNLMRGISHDLRTPLTSISGNAYMLMENSSLFDNYKKKELYTSIYDDSVWLINLIENILSVTKIEEGSVELKMEPQICEEIIDEALLHLDRRKSEHIIEKKISPEIIMAKMDSKLIMQVIINLVDNAIKYTQVGSKIEIRLYRKNNKAIFEVADNGDGIDDESKIKIFDKYFTHENKYSDSRRGFGLGLPLCESIIKAHGGTINVYDNKPEGTVFKFELNAEDIKFV